MSQGSNEQPTGRRTESTGRNPNAPDPFDVPFLIPASHLERDQAPAVRHRMLDMDSEDLEPGSDQAVVETPADSQAWERGAEDDHPVAAAGDAGQLSDLQGVLVDRADAVFEAGGGEVPRPGRAARPRRTRLWIPVALCGALSAGSLILGLREITRVSRCASVLIGWLSDPKLRPPQVRGGRLEIRPRWALRRVNLSSLRGRYDFDLWSTGDSGPRLIGRCEIVFSGEPTRYYLASAWDALRDQPMTIPRDLQLPASSGPGGS
ncbi:MAG: hypothetical protein OER86_03130 [Phycisphaerae bacterium]|nr:hypothetical protein [Phycisphaerae bacterium]